MNLFPWTHPIDTRVPTDYQTKSPFGNYEGTLGTSQLGIPTICWIDFYDQHIDPLTNAVTYIKILSISECLVAVEQNPRINKTYCLGKDGSTKTYIGMDDYNILIDGFVFNVNDDGTSAGNMEGVYPKDRMNKLQHLIQNQGSTYGIKIYCPYLEQFGETGIQFIVVTKSSFPQEEGGYSQQKFQITAISDSFNDLDSLYSPYFA